MQLHALRRVLLETTHLKRLSDTAKLNIRTVRGIRDGKHSPTLDEIDAILLAMHQHLIEAERLLPYHLSRRGVPANER